MKVARRKKGSSLIITLLVLVVLSTIVVAFMQSMAVERMTSRSVANAYQAQLAAEAGLAAALEKISEHSVQNQVVAYDKSVTDPTLRPLVFIEMDSTGAPLATNKIALAGNLAVSGVTHTFNLGTNEIRKGSMFPLTNSAGKTNGLYSFVVQDNAGKQNLIRYSTITRTFASTLREVPLINTSNAPIAAGVTNALSALALANTNWYTNVITPASFNQLAGGINPGVDETWADTENWSPLVNRESAGKINLRKFKFYLDKLSSSQATNNPKAAVVDALLGQPSSVDPQSSWGGGTLKWLISTKNPKPYTLAQAKQIAANLIDYLDSDLHPTTDSADTPSYLGVEGRYESDGSVTGHPYVTAMGFGLVFNLSNAGGLQGWLNSTRVLTYWALVNPWSHETLNLTLGTSYQPEFEIEVEGSATGGLMGSEAKQYFISNLSERLTEGPVNKLARNAGSTFPSWPSGNSYASFYSLQPDNRQPANMTFTGIKFRIKKARLKFISTDGTQSYVQILNSLGGLDIPMNPSTFTLPVQNGGSVVYNPGTTKSGVFLAGDPRLNFDKSSWIVAELASPGGASTVPSSSPPTAPFTPMDTAEGDGAQGVPNSFSWYSSANTTNHFFVRSPPLIPDGNNPNTKEYDPRNAPGAVAVDTIGELGYLFAGRPWQTLNLVRKDSTLTRPDFQLLDFVDAGTMPATNIGSAAHVNGKVNVNTASAQTLRGLFTDIPGMSEATLLQLIGAMTNSINADTNYPYIGSVDYGAITNLAQGVTNKFARENVIRRIANLTTTRSEDFTVYSYGEARQNNKTVARANLVAQVKLVVDGAGNVTPKIIRKAWK